MNQQPSDLTDNPLLATSGLPPFDRIRPEHVEPAIRDVLADAERTVTALEQSATPTWEGLMRPLQDMDIPFEHSGGPVGHLFGMRNSPELRKAYEAVLDDVVKFGLRANQSQPLYEALKQLREGDEWSNLTQTQQRIVEHRLLNAELAGIGLQGEVREKFNTNSQELSRLGTDFANHVLDATKAYSLTLDNPADVEGMPSSALELASHAYNQKKEKDTPESTAEKGPWRFTLDGPSFTAFMSHCKQRPLREKMYRAFITRASEGEWDNSPIITRILELRKEQAQLLGYDNYAEVSLATKMAPDVAAVEDMFESLRSASWDAGVRDQQEIEEFAKTHGQSEPILNWDVGFWAERLREERFQFTDEELRPYFSLKNVLQGLFDLVERIFSIKVTPADGEAPIWHEDVRFFKIADANGQPIAAFYLDPYSRPEDKRGGAWMNDCLSRRWISGELQIPVAHLVCNSTPPVGNRPSLMTFREVETLFHEFGHGLQHMLTTVDEADAAGISGVEWDAVELPSQFMENWCYHRATLLGMTSHYQTGESLPEELFEKICGARTYRAGSMMLRQLLFGMTDMALHTRFNPNGQQSVFELQREIAAKVSVLPPLPEDRSLCAFQHIFSGGYAAGYYSYKWAEVLSADAFGAFEEVGLDNDIAIAEVGKRFRDTVLSLGGSRHPMEIFKDFRGREPSPEPLLKQCGLLSDK